MTKHKSEKSSKKTGNNIKPKKVPMKNSTSSILPPVSDDVQKWTSLSHNGVLFPPPYKPHGVKMLYKGIPVDLYPEQEEAATMYAGILDMYSYVENPKFNDNFMADWQKILGKDHVIQSLEHCDFTPIYEWHQNNKERKKTREETMAFIEERRQEDEKYLWAIVDGVKERVENFRVGPPGLFRGRDQHPKSGKLKRRICPSDITINIGKDSPIPECPFPGQRWKSIVHDNTVTWLARWKDPFERKGYRYVILAGRIEKEKYEKARLLKNYIKGIRAAYTNDITSDDIAKRQTAVVTYLIDKLSLRAGDDKKARDYDDGACCTLKVKNLVPVPPNILKFDRISPEYFRSQNVLEVETAVYEAIQQFRSGKNDGDYLFDKLDIIGLSAYLNSLMPGLTAAAFCTYNSSIALDNILSRETIKGVDVSESHAAYIRARKKVAKICKLERTTTLNIHKDERFQRVNMLRLRKQIEELTIDKMECDDETKEVWGKMVDSTSKKSDFDPRIILAWCKRNDLPVEKKFTRPELERLEWAIDVCPGFRY